VAGAGFDGGIRGGLIWSIAIRIAVMEAVSVRGAVRELARPELYKLTGEAFSSSMSKGGRDLGLWVVEALYRPGDARVGSDSRSGGGQMYCTCTVVHTNIDHFFGYTELSQQWVLYIHLREGAVLCLRCNAL
jgi:hypothetical protein